MITEDLGFETDVTGGFSVQISNILCVAVTWLVSTTARTGTTWWRTSSCGTPEALENQHGYLACLITWISWMFDHVWMICEVYILG